MTKNQFLKALASSTLLLALSGILLAQGTTSRFTGTVTDTSGAGIPGATVSLTDESRGSTLTTTTGSNGNYNFDLIQAGTYTVSVEKQGFKKFVSRKNMVNLNVPANVSVVLEVGDVSAVVNVENTVEQVQTSTSGNLGTTIEQKAVESLPIVGLRGRNPLDLVDFQPGVTVGSNTGGGVHVNGSRDRSFNYTLDGIDINESSAGGSNFTPLRPNPDSIQEFQIVTANFTAELGRSTGAQVTFVTRSGTNDYHGNLFEFYQTPGVNANEFENNLLGIPRRKFLQHIYGGSLGGPIPNFGLGEGTPFRTLRDKAFFFVNLQFLKANETGLVQRTVYTPQARAGIFRYVQGGRNNPAGTTGATVDASGAALLPNCSAAVTTNCIAT
ncbi:MAG: carboxypeptidase regulatory-like domain-containing protein, partial [Pyrinomonadaceae bacterium]